MDKEEKKERAPPPTYEMDKMKKSMRKMKAQIEDLNMAVELFKTYGF